MHDRHLWGKGGEPFSEITLHPERLEQPLRWRKPRRVAVCLMGDLFHKDVPEEYIDSVFAVMAICEQHTFMVLTKRPGRMAEYLAQDEVWVHWYDHMPSSDPWEKRNRQDRMAEPYGDNWPLPKVWLGTSIEDQPTADERMPHLLRCSAALRFISIEPMLGEISFPAVCRTMPGRCWCNAHISTVSFEPLESRPWPFHWVIVGSESGPGARPMDLDWVRSIRDQCHDDGVPLFFKQMIVNGKRINMPEIDGRVWDQMPEMFDSAPRK